MTWRKQYDDLKLQIAEENAQNGSSSSSTRAKDYKIVNIRLMDEKEAKLRKLKIQEPELVYETKPVYVLNQERKESRVALAMVGTKTFDTGTSVRQIMNVKYSSRPISTNIQEIRREFDSFIKSNRKGETESVIHLVKTKLYKQNQAFLKDRPRMGLTSFTRKCIETIQKSNLSPVKEKSNNLAQIDNVTNLLIDTNLNKNDDYQQNNSHDSPTNSTVVIENIPQTQRDGPLGVYINSGFHTQKALGGLEIDNIKDECTNCNSYDPIQNMSTEQETNLSFTLKLPPITSRCGAVPEQDVNLTSKNSMKGSHSPLAPSEDNSSEGDKSLKVKSLPCINEEENFKEEKQDLVKRNRKSKVHKSLGSEDLLVPLRKFIINRGKQVPKYAIVRNQTVNKSTDLKPYTITQFEIGI